MGRVVSDAAEGEALLQEMGKADPDLDPVWGLLIDDADVPAEGDALLKEMSKADPDLDPVWGLLIDDAEVLEKTQLQASAIHLSDCHGEAGGYPVNPASPNTGILGESKCGSFLREAQPSDEESGEEPGASPASVPSRQGKSISNVEDKPAVPATKFALPNSEADHLPQISVTRWDVQGCDAFVLDGVLTAEECDMLVKQAEGLWTFWETDPERKRASFRNAHTVEVQHSELADRIWSRVGSLVQPSVTMCEEDERFEVDIEGTWVPYAMNPNLLLSRYLDGGHFSPHTDGTTVVDFNRRTFYSCVLFLNDSPWGGQTRIYQDAQMRKELTRDDQGRLTGDPALILAEIPPKPGRMLVFYHRLMHEGVPAAEKYIIRTDVLYRRVPEICTAPEDQEAFRLYEEAQLCAEHGQTDAAASLFRRAFKLSPALKAVYRS